MDQAHILQDIKMIKQIENYIMAPLVVDMALKENHKYLQQSCISVVLPSAVPITLNQFPFCISHHPKNGEYHTVRYSITKHFSICSTLSIVITVNHWLCLMHKLNFITDICIWIGITQSIHRVWFYVQFQMSIGVLGNPKVREFILPLCLWKMLPDYFCWKV